MVSRISGHNIFTTVRTINEQALSSTIISNTFSGIAATMMFIDDCLSSVSYTTNKKEVKMKTFVIKNHKTYQKLNTLVMKEFKKLGNKDILDDITYYRNLSRSNKINNINDYNIFEEFRYRYPALVLLVRKSIYVTRSRTLLLSYISLKQLLKTEQEGIRCYL